MAMRNVQVGIGQETGGYPLASLGRMQSGGGIGTVPIGLPQPGAGGGMGSQDWSQGLGVSGGYEPWNPNADPGMGVHNPAGDYRAQWSIGDIQNDPGYQYQQQEAARATNAALAARGLSNSGGALKELQDRAQGIASTQAGDSFNRYMGQLGFNAGQGQQGWNNAQSALGNAYNRFAGDRSYYQGERQRLFGNATGEDQRQWDNAFRGGQQQWNNDFQQNQSNFDNYYRLANLGLNATGQNAGYLSGYGDNLAGLYGDQGNVNAGVTTGQANQWQQGIGGAAGAGMDYWGARR